MNFCPYCGAKLKENSNYCSSCGGKISTSIEETKVFEETKVNSKTSSLFETGLDSMSPREREDTIRKIKNRVPLAILELLIGIGCMLFSITTYIVEKNRYYGFSHPMTEKELLALLIGIIGTALILIGTVFFILYFKVKDKLK